MKTSLFLMPLLAVALLTIPAFAQSPSASPASGASVDGAATTTNSVAGASGQMTEADMNKMMAQMMELSKPSENHKLLADLAGTWDYTVKMWMNPEPNAKPETYKGTAVRKSMMD